MGLCFTRDKDEINYDLRERYVYCDTCMAKIKYHQIYILAHSSKTHIFCSRSCYGRWLAEK